MKNFHFLILFTMLFLASSTISFAQEEESGCGVPDPPKDEIRETETETESSFETCFGCNWHSPKIIRLVFHVIRDENGEHNFYPAVQFLLEGIVDVANQKLANNQPPSNPGVPNQPIGEINIQYELADVRYYDQQNWAYPNVTYPALDPNLLDVVFLEQSGDWFGTGCNDPNFCSGILCCAGGWAPGNLNGRAVLNRSFHRYVFETLQPNCYNIFNGDEDAAWTSTYADILIHEIGHMTGLSHPTGNDGCTDTPVLSTICSSNNFMSGCACNKGSFTCCQIDRMHNAFESGNYPFVVEKTPECQASFVSFECGQCSFCFFNNSTASSDGVILNNTWCVRDLAEPGDAGISHFEGFNLTFNPPCNGDFQVCLRIEDSNGCISEYCEEISANCSFCECQPGKDTDCTGIISPPQQNLIGQVGNQGSLSSSIIPNPASTRITVSLASYNPANSHTITLYNSFGKKVNTANLPPSTTSQQWDVSGLENGVYFVQIISETNESSLEKVIISH